MNFNQHLDLKDKHSFFSASQYHWLNYSDDKLEETYRKKMATERGTQLHEFAARCIQLGIKLQGRTTLAQYVNDAIGFRMSPEVVLYYSQYAFATTDAIAFSKNKKTGRYFLRIHDLKTGESPTSVHQLEIYAAYFCLEYKYDPADIDFELRIYQSGDYTVWNPESQTIQNVINKIINGDKIVTTIEMEG